MTQFKRIVDAYLQGYITLAERNAYINAGKLLNDLIEVGDEPPYPAVGNLDMDSYKIVELLAGTAETDAANLSQIRVRLVSKTFKHDDGSATVATVPAKSRIDWVYFDITEIFDGTIKLGDGSVVDRLMTDSEIVHTVGKSGPTHIGYDYAAQTAVLLTLTGTTGEGTCYMQYTMLP